MAGNFFTKKWHISLIILKYYVFKGINLTKTILAYIELKFLGLKGYLGSKIIWALRVTNIDKL